MAITRSQQARQMYNEGSKKPVTQAGVKNFLGKQEMVKAPKFWLSEPGHVKAKLAYITDEEEKILIDKNLYGSLKGKPNKGPAGLPSLQGGDFGSEDAGTGDSQGGGDKGNTGKGRDLDFQQRGMTKGDYATGRGANRGGDRDQNFGGRQNFAQKAFSGIKDYITSGGMIGALGRGLTGIFGGPKSFSEQYGYATDYQGTTGRSSVDDDDDDDRGGGDGLLPLYAQLGFPSQAAYMASLQRAGLPAAVQPKQDMDLNRIAYRFMADGGFLDDEPRQAYGLGSIVKKAFKTVRKPFKAVTKTLKKVAKSPTGRLLLAVAAPYALGPAVASSAALSGLTAAQQAALISGATTGITQLASGEDLDLKDIAISAAIGGGTAKMFPRNIPGKPVPQGVSGSNKALFTSDAAMRGTPNLFDADDVVLASQRATSDPSKFTAFTKNVLNPQGIGQAKESTGGILQTIKDLGIKAKDSKLTDILLRNDKGGISPTKSILLASALSGLAAKKEQEPDEFSETDRGPGIDIASIRRRPFDFMAPRFAGSQFDFYAAEGGQAKKEPVAKKVMPLLDMGGKEMDLRAEGGFIPIGRMEKADDVPARLSKNEFVFTADAVRNAGDGDVDKGAEVMYNMMKNLEAGGDVSEESQGLEGARKMFQTSKRLEEVL